MEQNEKNLFKKAEKSELTWFDILAIPFVWVWSQWYTIVVVVFIVGVVGGVCIEILHDNDRRRENFAFGSDWDNIKAEHQCVVAGYVGRDAIAYYTCNDGTRIKFHRKVD